MLPWSLEHHVFVCDTYVNNDESVTEIQRLLKRRFNTGRHGNVPSRNSILSSIPIPNRRGGVVVRASASQSVD